MSHGALKKSKHLSLNEKKFNSLQRKAHYQLLAYTADAIFFGPIPKLATTFSHQVILINEKTGIPEQVYYDQILQIVIDGEHFEIQHNDNKARLVKLYRALFNLFRKI